MRYIVNRDIGRQVCGSNCDNINLDNNVTGGYFVMILIVFLVQYSSFDVQYKVQQPELGL